MENTAKDIDGESNSGEKDYSNKNQYARPKLLWVNAIIAIGVIVLLVSGIIPAGLAFMIGLSFALPINYPKMKDQSERIKAHASSALTMATIILAAGTFLGILTGTGMLDAIAEDGVTIMPEAVVAIFTSYYWFLRSTS